MIKLLLHSKEEGPTEESEHNIFDYAADAARLHIIPEIANAIDDAISDGGRDMKKRVKQLTDLLAKLCSPSMELVVQGIREWELLVIDDGLGYAWAEWIE